jgi:pimeloyl-ACP methyl ester carboxylesterase
MSVTIAELTRVTVAGVPIEISERGEGRPILVLHGGYPSGRIDPADRALDLLAKNTRVIVPTHPGFGLTAAPRDLTSVEDLAYLYLDLLEAMDLKDAVLVGLSLGGYIAAEMAVKSTARLSHLVLVDAVGIKVSDRETRDIADIFAMTDQQIAEIVYAQPAKMMRDPKALAQEELTYIARSRESTGRYAWSPWMHDPKLKARLRRIDVPTLVLWGAADRVVTPEYGRAYAASIAGARFETIDGAGHFPHLEQPDQCASRVLAFVQETARR